MDREHKPNQEVAAIGRDDDASAQRVRVVSNAEVQKIVDQVLAEASPSDAKSVTDALQQMTVDVAKFPNASDHIDWSQPLVADLSQARQHWRQALTLASTDDKESLQRELSLLYGTLHRLKADGTQYEAPVKHALGFAQRAFELAK